MEKTHNPDQAPAHGKPRLPIRRFDIFAEWNRLRGKEKLRLDDSDARAFGVAVATIVAARKFSGYQREQISDWKRRAKRDTAEDHGDNWWRHLGTAEKFDHSVISRMGDAFYRSEFQPAIRSAWDEGKRYEDIRDTLRAEWNGAPDSGVRRTAG